MRKQFVKTIEETLKNDPRIILLLGDIGVFGFRNSFVTYPDRVYNIGILEQATIGMASGLSMHGLIPVVHTIAPFIVERALEQIKNDFGYQKLGGNFVSVGASYDYASLGGTHHCPGDVGILKNIPGVEIIVPGTPAEFDILFKASYANGNPTYFRLSERSNSESHPVEFGKAHIVKKGSKATVIAVGPMLEQVKEACKDFDVTILYYTTLEPFDRETLSINVEGGKIIVCEPYYSGALALDISAATAGKKIELFHIGVPRKFIHHYGKTTDIDTLLKLTTGDIRTWIQHIL
jgi:transketolase